MVYELMEYRRDSRVTERIPRRIDFTRFKEATR